MRDRYAFSDSAALTRFLIASLSVRKPMPNQQKETGDHPDHSNYNYVFHKLIWFDTEFPAGTNGTLTADCVSLSKNCSRVALNSPASSPFSRSSARNAHNLAIVAEHTRGPETKCSHENASIARAPPPNCHQFETDSRSGGFFAIIEEGDAVRAEICRRV